MPGFPRSKLTDKEHRDREEEGESHEISTCEVCVITMFSALFGATIGALVCGIMLIYRMSMEIHMSPKTEEEEFVLAVEFRKIMSVAMFTGALVGLMCPLLLRTMYGSFVRLTRSKK